VAEVAPLAPSLTETTTKSPLARSTATATATPARTIATSPVPPGEGDGMLDINIPDTDIREVLELLSRAGNLNILASKNVTGTVKASLTGVDIDTALKAILRSTGYQARREGGFVYVGTAEDFQAMDHSLDRVGTRVYRPNYISAAELQTLVTPMLTPTIGSVSVSSAADVGIAADNNGAGGNSFAGAEVVLVRDYEAVLAQVDQVFEEVDRQPLQVSIEAMILSVSLSDETKIGVNWELLRNHQHIRFAFGSPLTTDVADMDLTNNSGLKVGFLDSSLASFLDALETVGETNVISSPRVMCLNKQRAEIHIGEQRGYVSTTVTETAATQSVEFLEVGTQLRLRPFISNDGLVRLEIHPELSTGTVEVTNNFTLPNKTVTQVTTNVMVRDGATLVIGGLLREDLETTTTQIPLLGSLPYVGPLFRNETGKTNRDEIIVLITPRIVWEPKFNCEGEYADCEFHQQHAVMADKMSHVSRVYYGRRYKRLAKAAWVAGDALAALRLVNMSIHFNSLDREATQLRSQIVANSPYGDRTVDWHLKEGLVPWTHPFAGKRLNNWVLDELHGPHTPLGQEPAPIQQQGQTGARTELVVPELAVPQEVIEAPQGEPLPDVEPPAGVDNPQELLVPEEA
jgi:type IV pilus assembly protein PilQ